MIFKPRLSVIAVFVSAAAVLIAGCSGGGNDMKSSTPAAQAPQITGASSLDLNQDTTSAPQMYRVQDPDSPPDSLAVSVATSDADVLPLSSLVIGGSGTDRSLTITSSAEVVGSSMVTLTVRDPGGLTATTTLMVRVNPVLVSFRTLTNGSFAMPEAGDLAKVSGVTVQPDADDDPTAFDALLQ